MTTYTPTQLALTKCRRLRGELLSRLHRAPAGGTLVFVKPCYWVLDVLGPDDCAVDIGLGFDADFSVAMLQRFPIRTLGIDPTKQHLPALHDIAARSGGRFTVLEAAVAATSGTLTFHESPDFVSGSLYENHPNIERTASPTSYDVRAITLQEALREAPVSPPAYVKIDIEGAEYDVLDAASDDDLRSVRQWSIEFHHYTIPDVPYSRTAAMMRRFRNLGFRMFTRDYVNVLFYQP